MIEHNNIIFFKFRDTDYYFSKCGKVLSTKNNKFKILKCLPDKFYPRVSLSMNGKITRISVHRIIAEMFIPNPENKPQVNHINGIKTDNRVENLEWCTSSENLIHGYKTSLHATGSLRYNSKLTEAQVIEIRNKYVPRIYSQRMLAKEFNVRQSTIHGILNNTYWNYITNE